MSRIIVLDDDPTGTQAAADVPVLLDPEAELPADPSYYVLTNTRAMEEGRAVSLVRRLRDRCGDDAEYVLRGDSTLRGHVFAEADALGAADGVLVFVPAYPAIGRATLGGVHRVMVNGRWMVAADTEFAADPVFGYSARTMTEWVRETGGRAATTVPLETVRRGGLDPVLRRAVPGAVVVPDVETDADLAAISASIDAARSANVPVVLRCAAPLAAMRAGRLAYGLLDRPLHRRPGGTLVVCGSHTEAAGAQLAALAAELRVPVRTASTEAALSEPEAEGRRVAGLARFDLAERGVALVASERARHSRHSTLGHGAKVMAALCATVTSLRPHLTAVIAKGGITSAQVARDGLGADRARVLGPLRPGVAVWEIGVPGGATLSYAVVPGNVGDERTLVDVADAFGLLGPSGRRAFGPIKPSG
ncbi:four-carbon acid sugar kinase family protein [Nonomuraea sp. NPDC052129]|uniref:four-carbon acid sugar kinase family protein n=1 Tax=Nonomuraea sp. NPDC052129 TaxID=3154651 RepID=UPI00342C79DB